MRSRTASLLVLCALVSLVASAQSLGELARKERERREKNKDQGVAARQFSETEIFGEDEEESDGAASSEGADAELSDAEAPDAESEEPTAPRSPVPDRIDIDLNPEPEKQEDESRDRKQREAEWRSRFKDARSRVERAREQKRVVDGIHYVQGMKYVDENGNTIIESLDQLRELVSDAARELTEAETALRDLEEEARRAGVPPGWLR